MDTLRTRMVINNIYILPKLGLVSLRWNWILEGMGALSASLYLLESAAKSSNYYSSLFRRLQIRVHFINKYVLCRRLIVLFLQTGAFKWRFFKSYWFWSYYMYIIKQWLNCSSKGIEAWVSLSRSKRTHVASFIGRGGRGQTYISISKSK